MSYLLGGITLPAPRKLSRQIIESAVEHIIITGKTTKRITRRKERYVLQYQNLTQAEVASILSEYALKSVRTFTVSESNLSIGPVDVLIDITNRSYPPSGENYLENLNVILSEVL